MIGYGVTLALILVLYPMGIWAMGRIKRERLFTLFFPFLTLALYICCVVKIGINAGVNDWNFHNALPTANVSPFTYCVCAVSCLFPTCIRKYLQGGVAMLSFGLLCSGMINCVFNIGRAYAFHWEMGLDSLLHAAVSWYGVYLVRSGQTQLTKKTCLISGGMVLGVAFCMMILNVILHTSFFGLSIYGEHNIYNIVVCENGYLSAIIYFIGLSAVLALGVLFQKLVSGKNGKRLQQGENSNGN